jgi:hypothetical protein
MTCVPYPADGEFCDGNSPDCDSSHSYCDAKEMRCQSRRPPGSPCTATGTLDSSGSECEISSLCISGVCRAFVGPGDACDASPSSPLGRCLGGLCVDQVCATPSVPVSCWKK